MQKVANNFGVAVRFLTAEYCDWIHPSSVSPFSPPASACAELVDTLKDTKSTEVKVFYLWETALIRDQFLLLFTKVLNDPTFV